MASGDNLAQAVLRGQARALEALASGFIVPRRNNFVERPWGGTRIRQFKGYHPLPDQAGTTGLGLGEAFEIAAFGDDREATLYASTVELPDGSRLSLAELLEVRGERILGASFVARYGSCFPLLPKTLDIKELLSVQGHPAGHTEVYIIIDSDPGATLRVGFQRDMEARSLIADLSRGIEQQRRLLELLGAGQGEQTLQSMLRPWLATRDLAPAGLGAELRAMVEATAEPSSVIELLNALKSLYWQVLDSMNAIAVKPGQVIHNATPARLLKDNGVPSAEVHALGNPEGREVLALEIRRPGPTFRAWDNVRFPIRDVDVEAAVTALNLRATDPSDFLVEPREIPERPGVWASVDSDFFRLEHLRPGGALPVGVEAQSAHCLHVLSGTVRGYGEDGRLLGELQRGDSALVPAGIGAYTLTSNDEADVVKVSLPLAE